LNATNGNSHRLHCEQGGSGSPTLVLLHGLGANAGVWDRLLPIIAERWPARWIAPDFRGHGRSFHQGPYSMGIHAADVAGLLAQEEEVVLLGHSMGGAVSLVLAAGDFGIRVRHVISVGVRIDWPAEDVSRMHRIARSPARLFATRNEALDMYLRVSGLKGLMEPDSACAQYGVAGHNGAFRLAMDPAANFVAGTPTRIGAVIEAIGAPLCMIAGEQDTMTGGEPMRRYASDVVVLPGLGHNLHVEAPQRLWEVVEPRILAYTRQS
jgi:pimeloyl-ACP methyl ester carboxylesterase